MWLLPAVQFIGSCMDIRQKKKRIFSNKIFLKQYNNNIVMNQLWMVIILKYIYRVIVDEVGAEDLS